MKIWTSILALLFVPQTQVLDIAQVQKALAPAVLLHIKALQVDEETLKTRRILAGCSGTFITSGTVLTAAHCFPGTVLNIWVKDINNKVYEGKLVKLDPPHDLALVSVIYKQPHTYVQLAKSVRVGEKIVNVGAPFGLGIMISEGIVARLGLKFKPFTGTYILQTAMINAGSSGGAALNEAGELIGVNTLGIGAMFGWAGISGTVDLATVKQFLGVK